MCDQNARFKANVVLIKPNISFQVLIVIEIIINYTRYRNIGLARRAPKARAFTMWVFKNHNTKSKNVVKQDSLEWYDLAERGASAEAASN